MVKQITIEQRIQVAKDRAIHELAHLANVTLEYKTTEAKASRMGYWTLNDEHRARIRALAAIIALPDDDPDTLIAVAAYLTGNEWRIFDGA